MSIKNLSQAALAAALGIDRAMVTRYKRKGMPVDSVAAAKTWRDQHVRGSLSACQADAGVAAEQAAARAGALLEAANMLLASGGDVTPMVPTIRQVMSDVPDQQRARVLPPPAVLEILTNEVAAAFQGGSADGAHQEPLRLEFMRPMLPVDQFAFWYAVAAGEVAMARTA